MQESLTDDGFQDVGVAVSVEQDNFVFSLTRPGEHRRWVWPVTEDVYHVTPDGTDADEHAVWLYTLAEEENTGFVHRR